MELGGEANGRRKGLVGGLYGLLYVWVVEPTNSRMDLRVEAWKVIQMDAWRGG